VKHALLIGIDRYPNLGAEYQLRGCVNDARLLRQVLVEHFGFGVDSVVSLHDGAATRGAILAAMERLVEVVADPADVVFFHFSGHGSRRTSAGGEEATGKDSTIMPSDSGRHPLPNLDISDDEINAWLQRLSAKTRAISLLFDCCHSGMITRDPFAAQVRAAPADTRSLAAMGVDPAALPQVAGKRAGDEPSWLALSDSYVAMSGCRATELAHEFTDERGGESIRHGALTHYFVQALLGAPPHSTYRDVFDSARVRVATQFPSQNPQIEGAQDRVLFGAGDRVPFRFVAVAAVQGECITLDGGAALGLHAGARWRVFPPGCKSVDGTAPLAEVCIERVGVLQSSARRVAAGGALVPGARCVEIAPGSDALRVAVALDDGLPPAAAAVAAGIDTAPLLRRVTDPAAAAWRMTPLPSAGVAPAAGWVVVDREGERATREFTADAANAVADTLAALEALARYRNALDLDNPESRLRVDFTLYRQAPEGQWQAMACSGETLRAGDCIAFEVANHEPRPVYISVLDFGISGRIHLLYPPNARSEQLEAGQTLRIGMDRRRIRLGLPAGFVGGHGREAFKLFVTSGETDFSWLQQAGTRGAATPRDRLARWFSAAYHGPATRDACLDLGDASGDDWRGLARTFTLTR
jgi:hypothetical protein